jgi:hypothetical protein
MFQCVRIQERLVDVLNLFVLLQVFLDHLDC